MAINDRVKVIRNRLKLKQAEFAVKLNIKQQLVSDIETGRVNIKPNILKTLFYDLNVDIHWLLFNEGNPFRDESLTPPTENIADCENCKHHIKRINELKLEKEELQKKLIKLYDSIIEKQDFIDKNLNTNHG